MRIIEFIQVVYKSRPVLGIEKQVSTINASIQYVPNFHTHTLAL